jgi:hypothetical protein
MALYYVLPDTLFQFLKCSRLRFFAMECHAVEIFGSELARAPNEDSPAVLIPLENRSWTDTQLSPHIGRYGNLSLSSEAGSCDRHALHYHGNVKDKSVAVSAPRI